MSGIIEGYNYDIFISYRQKDNKGDRWVSEFVEALKTELESTFKEEVSVYFDINPHDGLLETHDVDASLKEKLKCLVFIPIISRTYCDPRSFAWEHEFMAFIEEASSDSLGLRVRLPNGNVASRILPVRIHELDQADVKLCETSMGGPLRAIDFIYKSSGVNRPLRNIEDNPRENLNHTFYRDQINKVANAVREIIEGIKYHEKLAVSETHEGITKQFSIIPENKKEHNRLRLWPVSLKIVVPLILLALIIFIIILSNAGIYRPGKRVALIPLTILGDEKLGNNESTFSEMLNDKLKIVGINIVPRLSMLQYTGTDKPLKVISRELNARYVVYGNIKRENEQVVIWLQLGRANNSLWSDRYTWNSEKLSQVIMNIVQNIAAEIKHELSPEQISLIRSDLTNNTDANMSYLSANAIMNDATFFSIYGTHLRDSTDFRSAIKSYDKALELDSLFAEAYAGRSTAISWGVYTGQLDSSYIEQCKADALRSLELKKSLPDGQIALGFYYYYCRKNELDQALSHFKTAAELTPFDYHPMYYMALVYRRMGQWEDSQKLMHAVIRNNPTEALFLTNIGLSYQYLHDYDSAIIFHQKAIDIMPGWPDAYVNKLYSILLRDGNSNEVWRILNTAASRSGKDLSRYRILLYINLRDFENALAEAKQLPPESRLTGEKQMNLAAIYDGLGNPGLSRSYYDSAIVIFNRFAQYYPDSPEIQISLSMAHAGAGNREEAIVAGENAISLSQNDSMVNSDMKAFFLQVLADLGEHDRALVLMEDVLKNPSPVSVKALQTDPVFDELRKNDAFRKLLKQYSRN